MTAALAIFGGSTTLVLVGVVVWLTYRHAKAKDAASTALDLYRDQQRVSDEWESKHEIEVVAHAATKGLLAKEHTLRVIAESQRNEAQRKARDLLRKHMRTATDDEIRETVADLFTAPLGLVPADGVRRETPRSEAPGTALLDPFSDV
jgi:predicted RNA-binding Zn ribbon-like protein